MDSKIIDRVIEGDATTDEAKATAKWLATEEGQAYLSYRYDRETNTLTQEALASWYGFDIPSNRMRTRLMQQLKTRIQTFRFKLVAAALIPFIIFGSLLFFISNRTGLFAPEQLAEITVPYGEQTQVVLSDGSLVQLNSGSTLRYPARFGLFNRKVSLQGEGYFSVAKDASRPFYVNTNEIKIKVTGTKFNLKAYPDDKIIAVALEEGSVDIVDINNKTYPLQPNQYALYDKQTGVCTINQNDHIADMASWREKKLNFYRTPLYEIIKTLERQFEVQFNVLDTTLLDYRFSISTSRVQIDQILSDLERVSDIKFDTTDSTLFTISAIE